MPTGYTADIYDGANPSLEEFARKAVRAMGVFIHQRDDGTDAPLTYPTDDTPRYLDQFKDSLRKEAAFRRLSEEEKYAKWSEYVEKATEERTARNEETAAINARYNRMINLVETKAVPERLQSFKDFMLQQLNDSKRADGGSWDSDPQSFYDWIDSQNEYLARRVKFDREYLQKARERHRESCEYIDALVETFGFEVEKR